MPEHLVSLRIEKLDEGEYLATSDTLQGLVVQGRTIAETMEIAQDVARKLIESYIEHWDPITAGMVPAAKVVTWKAGVRVEEAIKELTAFSLPDAYLPKIGIFISAARLTRTSRVLSKAVSAQPFRL